MLKSCVDWPEQLAAQYRRQGYWADITLNQMLTRSAGRLPDKTALVHGERRVSYRELDDSIAQLAVRFAENGLQPRDRVVLQLTNSAEFIIVFFALLRIGVIPVLALPAHRHREVSHFIAQSAAVAYIAPERARGFDYRVMASDIAAARLPSLHSVYILGEPLAGQRSLTALLSSPTIADTADRLRDLKPAADDIALMLMSGGTTGIPKLIPRTHNDYVYNCTQSAAVAGFGADSVFLAMLPMAHNYTLGSPGVLGALAWGGTSVIALYATPETICRLIEREQVTVLSAAMPLVVSLLNSNAPETYDVRSLKVFMSGGAKLAPALRRRIEQQFNCIYQESYGTAEGLLNMTRLDDPEEIRFTSSGRPISQGDEIKVIDERGQEVPEGEVGELVCRGPYTVRGYYNAAEATAAAYTADGFYRMGDAVRKIGADLYVEGRFKDLINRGGEKISCEEIENHLLAHPRIKSACVVAMPDHTFGEKACAFVILFDNSSLSFEELKTYLLGRDIAKFKLPERLEIVREFPISAAGKILRRELRDAITRRLAAEQIVPVEGTDSPASGRFALINAGQQ
jgi:2,3-dihydroxybenzoate---[aryl-carrier protein] ligase